MKRLGRIAARLLGGVAALTGIALIAVLVAINVAPGRRLIERQVASLTGGTVRIEGVSGFLPGHIGLGRLMLADRKGVWLEADGLDLRWSPLSLLAMDAHIGAVSARRIAFLRPAVSDTAASSASSGGPTKVRARIDLDSLKIDRLEIGREVSGIGAAFSVSGHAHIDEIAPLLNGLTVRNFPGGDAALRITRLDVPGEFDLSLKTPGDAIALTVSLHEGTGGFLPALTGMDQLAPADLRLSLNGPRNAAALDFALKAGAITASSSGRLDLYGQDGDLRVKADAPAMTLSSALAWNRIALDAALRGKAAAPTGNGTLEIDALSAGGVSVGALRGTFDGSEGGGSEALAHLRATIDGLKLPGSAVFAAAPVVAEMRVQPLAAGMPLTAAIDHPLLHATAALTLRPAAKGRVTLAAPDLHAFSGLIGTDLAGNASLAGDFALPAAPRDDLTLNATGALAITGGQAQAAGLIGKDGRLAVALTRSPDNLLTVKTLTLDGAGLHLAATGTLDQGGDNTLAADARLALPDLARARAGLLGDATLTAHAQGTLDDLAAKAALSGDFGMKQVPKGPLALNADFRHLPAKPDGTLTAGGTLDGAKLALDSALNRDAQGAFHLALNRLDWNSLSGKGALTLNPGAKLPVGDLDVSVRNLADFRRLIGQAIAGHLALSLHTAQLQTAQTGEKPVLKLGLDGALSMRQVGVQALALKGTIADPLGDFAPDLTFDLDGLRSAEVTGHVKGSVKGPQSAMALALNGAFQNVMGAPAGLDAAALLDLTKKTVRVGRLDALAKGETLRLSGPVSVSFGETTGVDHLRATLGPQGVAPATIDASGTLKPRLAFDATVNGLTPAVAKPFAPSVAARGTIAAKAHLTGTLAAPSGTLSLTGHGLRMEQGDAASLPPAEIVANAALNGSAARIDATVNAGPKLGLALRGRAPLSSTGAIALAATGRLDFSAANAILGARGMEAQGTAAIDLNVSGTAAAPRASGRIALNGVSFTDYAQGAQLSDIRGALVASGDSLTLENIVAKAGDGTIALDGSLGLFRPGLPVDLRLVAKKARPVVSDLLTAVIDADLRVRGQAGTRVDVDGRIDLPSVTVNIPDSMPASVPQLTVIRPGQKEETSGGNLVVGLGINVVSPGGFTVRGHGLDAEMQGRLHVGGTIEAPAITGGFDLRRGNFNLAGINLNFTHGRVGFNGTGVSHNLDPTLDFRADRNVNGTLASLLVTGYASAPKIDFTSVPSLPRDQVLALLLFGTDSHSLSTTQLAELAAAVAQIAGGSSFDPISKVRNAIGLDRLAIGGGSGVNNGGTSVEAGKYVMKGVYVGAKQAMSGSGTQAQVQVDLTKRLKLNTTVGTGGKVTGFTTPENDPGSSIGLSYRFDY